MVTIQDLSGSKCTDIEWTEYCWMPQVHTNETPSGKSEFGLACSILERTIFCLLRVKSILAQED